MSRENIRIELCAVCSLSKCPGENDCSFFQVAVEASEEEYCGMCGELLRVCEIGPCPWGVIEKPVWIEFGQGYADWIECPENCVECELIEVCEYAGTYVSARFIMASLNAGDCCAAGLDRVCENCPPAERCEDYMPPPEGWEDKDA